MIIHEADMILLVKQFAENNATFCAPCVCHFGNIFCKKTSIVGLYKNIFVTLQG